MCLAQWLRSKNQLLEKLQLQHSGKEHKRRKQGRIKNRTSQTTMGTYPMQCLSSKDTLPEQQPELMRRRRRQIQPQLY